ncbi:LysR family transcriptional regulator [Vibrio lentus]|uniref:LysR family transcriptional regulator n=1 Tax=Vibrio lentus TaxID=136468 RepID=UPI000C858A25|nr:LysR family transcriptional regulator [Vibrio lentus]PMH27717.1 LysR family transcriptional regulator [Vibrio lentus]PMK69700.1 LysR family transcriptional regulator [Vibrio lentus]
MNFSLEQLSTFVTVYEQKSFSKAAAKLDKHRSTVGQVVVNLEDILDVALFERKGRSVEATQEGKLLYRYAKQAVEQLKAFDKIALNISRGEPETINIGYLSFMPQLILVDIRMQLQKDFPGCRVNMLVMNKKEIKQGIEDGTLHFGFVNTHESRAMNSFHAVYLETLTLIPFVSKGSELSKTPPNELFSKLKISKQLILKSLIDEGMADKVTLSANYELVDQLALVIQLVQLDLGWALLPRSVIYSEFVQQNLIELKPTEIKKGLEIPISLWSPHSLHIEGIRESIVTAANEYIQHVYDEYF